MWSGAGREWQGRGRGGKRGDAEGKGKTSYVVGEYGGLVKERCVALNQKFMLVKNVSVVESQRILYEIHCDNEVNFSKCEENSTCLLLFTFFFFGEGG